MAWLKQPGSPGCGCGCAGLYLAANLVSGILTEADLPDQVRLNGVTYGRDGTRYGNTTNGVIFEDGVWARYLSGVRKPQSFLITGWNGQADYPNPKKVYDLFANTYTVDITLEGSEAEGAYSVSVDRNSLCRWGGVFPVAVGDGTSDPGAGDETHSLGGIWFIEDREQALWEFEPMWYYTLDGIVYELDAGNGIDKFSNGSPTSGLIVVDETGMSDPAGEYHQSGVLLLTIS